MEKVMQDLVTKHNFISERIYQLYVFVFIALLFIVNNVINQFINGDLFTLLAWSLFLLLIYVKDIKFLLKYSYILFMQCSNILGIYICENSTLWLTELNRYSEPFGSLLLATVSHWVFFCALWYFETYFKDIGFVSKTNKKIYNDNLLTVIGIVLLIVSVIAFLHVLSNPAFKLGLDRFRYAETFLHGVWKLPDKLLGLSIPLIGILYIFNFKKTAISILAFYSAYLFFIGNKFGGFLNLFFLSVPTVYALNKTDKVLRKTFVLGVLVSSFMVGIVFFHNYLTYGHGLGKNFIYLEQRFAQQGQLWWAQYGKEKHNGFKINELNDETKTYFDLKKQDREEWNHGIYKVMRNITPQDIYDKKIAAGSRYASATLASLYYYFKEFGLIVGNVILAFIFWLVTTWYYTDYISGDVIGTVISCKYFIWMHMVATQADFDIIFSFKALLGVIVYVCYRFVISSLKNKKGKFEIA